MANIKGAIKVISFGVFIAGAVLLGVGSAGTATPLIIAGILLVMASGAGGMIASIEHASSRTSAYSLSNAATAATV